MSNEELRVGASINNPADAQLIAAAPDLLEATKALLNFINYCDTTYVKDDGEILMAVNAIKKATGSDGYDHFVSKAKGKL